MDLPDAATFITAGHYHTVVLTEAGELWAWGRNAVGQLGVGSKSTKDDCTPQRIQALAGRPACHKKITEPIACSIPYGGQLWICTRNAIMRVLLSPTRNLQ